MPAAYPDGAATVDRRHSPFGFTGLQSEHSA
jgi:hypothetical protein